MTVNEALWESGLMDKFDQAVEENDLKILKEIIKEIELDESYIETLIKHYNLKK